jgi:hypothetical protein
MCSRGFIEFAAYNSISVDDDANSQLAHSPLAAIYSQSFPDLVDWLADFCH